MQILKSGLSLLLIFSLASCSGPQKVDTGKEPKIKTPTKAEKLNALKDEFKNEILVPMGKEISTTLTHFKNIQDLKTAVQKKSGKDFETIIKLEKTFYSKHGKEAKRINTILNVLKDEYENKKYQAETLASDIQADKI